MAWFFNKSAKRSLLVSNDWKSGCYDEGRQLERILQNRESKRRVTTSKVYYIEEHVVETDTADPRLYQALDKLGSVLQQQNQRMAHLEDSILALSKSRQPSLTYNEKQPIQSISVDLENLSLNGVRKPLSDILGYNGTKTLSPEMSLKSVSNAANIDESNAQILKKLEQLQNSQEYQVLNMRLQDENNELKQKLLQHSTEKMMNLTSENPSKYSNDVLPDLPHSSSQDTTILDAEALRNENERLQFELLTLTTERNSAISAAEQRSKANISNLIEQYKREISLRRKYYNQLVEIKGNIRAICRIRGAITEEERFSDNLHFNSLDPSEISVTNSAGRRQTFHMDSILKQTDGQTQVFEEVRHLIQSCLDGFNVCIFAYGHTGSGKTHTMEGPTNDPGVNRRALAELFDQIAIRTEHDDWQYEIRMSLLEIYNESLNDLLSSQSPSQKLEIRLDANGALKVPGLTEIVVNTVDDVERIILKGNMQRKTSATNRNIASSRSHAILRGCIIAHHKSTGSKHCGHLNLVDLAGSERVSTSGADGKQLKEAQHINKSLSELGNVVNALRQKQAHVPFRNSQLTRLLQDSLRGESKTAVIVQLAPGLQNAAESISSLNFAQKISDVELGSGGAPRKCSCARSAVVGGTVLARNSPPITF